MPNHVHNTVTVHGPKADRDSLVALMQSAENPFDFNRIILMPPSLDLPSGSRSDDALAIVEFEDGDPTRLNKILAYPYVVKLGITTLPGLVEHLEQRDAERRQHPHPDTASPSDALTLRQLGRQIKRNLAEHGCRDWYGWCPEHWGTKWNSYGHEPVHHGRIVTRFSFLTAWSDPRPVFEALSARFPTLHFKIWCDGEVDEEYGYALN